MRTPSILFLFALLAPAVAQAQPSTTTVGFSNTNSVQLELGGHGVFYSVNYERVLLNAKRFKTAAQIGIAYYPVQTGVRDYWIPISVNEIISFKNHHIELGVGMVIIREAARNIDNSASEWFWSGVPTGRLGYRYQKPDGRWTLRVGFTPFLEVSSLEYLGSDYHRAGPAMTEFIPFGGLSIGRNF